MIEDREKKQMSKTDENYLKTILILQRRHGVATAADLGKVLSAGISTVYNAINKLERDGYISSIKGTRGKKPAIELTEKGKEIADNMFARHQKIQNWLMLLGTPEEIAESEACMLEHGLSENTMKIIAKHVGMAKENFGEQASYPQKMKQMAYALECMHQRKTGMTEMDKMEDAIIKHGGYETLVQQAETLTALGGEDVILQKRQVVESLGGVDAIKAQNQAIEDMGGLTHIGETMKTIENLGGLEEICATMEVVKTLGGQEWLGRLEAIVLQLGGISKLKRTIQLYEPFGEPKKMKENIFIVKFVERSGGLKGVKRKLETLDAYGGVEGLVNKTKKLEKIQRILDDK